MPFVVNVRSTKRRRFVLRLASAGSTFSCSVTDPAELEVIREIFLDDEYKVALQRDPEVIFDLGSNIGASILFFHSRYPNARIVGVEPDPKTFSAATGNVGHLPSVTLMNVAVAGRLARRTFHSSSESAFSSFTEFTGPQPHSQALTVPSMTIDSIMEETHVDTVDLMKIDIEGAEFEAIQAFVGLAAVNVLVGEFHADLSGRTLPDFVALLDDFEVTTDGVAFRAVRRTPSR